MRAILVTCGLLALAGCSRASPAGFWTRYHAECIESQGSDQGPWGGKRVLTWRACGSVVFDVADARAYAEAHGWKYGRALYVFHFWGNG